MVLARFGFRTLGSCQGFIVHRGTSSRFEGQLGDKPKRHELMPQQAHVDCTLLCQLNPLSPGSQARRLREQIMRGHYCERVPLAVSTWLSGLGFRAMVHNARYSSALQRYGPARLLKKRMLGMRRQSRNVALTEPGEPNWGRELGTGFGGTRGLEHQVGPAQARRPGS